MRTQLTGLAALGLLLLLSGCNIGPDYAKPKVPAAPAYSEVPPAQFLESPGWKAAQPADATLRGDWWELFGDPQLSALEVQVPLANQTLRAAEANFRQARATIAIYRADLYPTISAGPTISSNHISGHSPTGSVLARGASFGNFLLPIDLNYEVDLWGRVHRVLNAAREQFQASAADLQNVKLSLQSELAVDYFELRSLDADTEILRNNVVAFQKALDLTQNRFEGGVASKAEVTQAQTELDQTQAQLIDLEQARAQYQHAIAVLIGKDPEQVNLPFAPLKATPPIIPTGVPSQLLERRPDIATAERRLASANEQIGIARAAYYPQLLITATGGFQGNSIVNWFTWPSRLWAVGPQVNQTLFDAGRRRGQVERARAAYDGYVADYQQSALTAFQQVEDNLAVLRVLEREAAKQHEATEAAESSVQLSVNRYKGGLVTYLEVITNQAIALTNERTEVDLERRRMAASVLLIKALGGGWDRSKLPRT